MNEMNLLILPQYRDFFKVTGRTSRVISNTPIQSITVTARISGHCHCARHSWDMKSTSPVYLFIHCHPYPSESEHGHVNTAHIHITVWRQNYSAIPMWHYFLGWAFNYIIFSYRFDSSGRRHILRIRNHGPCLQTRDSAGRGPRHLPSGRWRARYQHCARPEEAACYSRRY